VKNVVDGCADGGGGAIYVHNNDQKSKINFTDNIFVENKVLGTCTSLFFFIYIYRGI
jgi:hypothetical protein